MKPAPLFPCLVALLGCALAPAVRAEETAKATDDDLRIRGIFESALPGTEHKSSLRLIVHPHLGDFRERDYLRTALGFRYGLTANWETTAETDWYFSHGVKHASLFHEYGFSSVHLGTKYRLGELWRSGWECSIGTDFVRPVGAPPPSVTDGLQHLAPYATFSRQLVRWPDWRVFWGLGYDFVRITSIAGELRKNQLTDDAVSVSAGVLWQYHSVTYTLESSYATMHPTSDSTRDIITVRPGLIWALPPKYTFGSTKGRWLLGFALRMSRGVDGDEVGASAKLRVNFDFKRLLGIRKDPPASPPPGE